MHLKALEIQGFKSFPEKTVVEFHKGVTAIIGPNGSGKSNVTDAIRWVLGEQSVKTLRGARMEDVIFTGTQSRRAMSYAEVTMIIDNSDGKLPLEYTEIQVTRRLYRSGESEYLLNKTTCRLRDIAQLFMDTGLGRDGYSIVGQGRVDDILSHRSEDRRKIFEEASGIVKFKTRKIETERKLQVTEQNLLRINDIINELEERLEPLSEQAENAKRYLNLHDELKHLEIALMLDNIDQHQQNLTQAKMELQLLLDDLARENTAMAELKTNNARTQEKLHQLDRDMDGKQHAFNRITGEIGGLSSDIALAEERIRQLNSRLGNAETEEAEILESISNLENDLTTRKGRELQLKKQLEIYSGQLTEAEAEMAGVLKTLDEAEKSVEAMKLRLDTQLEKLFDDKSSLNEIRSQTSLVASRQKTIAGEKIALVTEIDGLNIQLEEVDTRLSSIEVKASADENSRNQTQAKLDQTRNQLTEMIDGISQNRQALENNRYRLKTLQDLERRHEGYGEAVRSILNKAETDPAFGQGILGSLGSLVQTEKDYETAVEIALGPAIQNIVTDHEKTASRLIEYLKTERKGRATFLPIASIKPRPIDRRQFDMLSGQQGFVGLASELVTYDSEIKGVVDYLLGRIVVAENLDLAVAMARKTGYSTRIVTLDGDVINPGGSMTGGSRRQTGPGVLTRAREINELEAAIAKTAKLIEKQQVQLPALEKELTDLGRQFSDLEAKCLEHSHLKIREESRRASIAGNLDKSKQKLEQLESENAQLDNQKDSIEQDIAQTELEIQNLEAEIARLRQSISEQEGQNRSEQVKRDELREVISDLKISRHSIEESLSVANEMSQRIEMEKTNHISRLDKHRQDLVAGREDLERFKFEIEQIEKKIRIKREEAAAVEAEATALGEEKSKLESEQATYFDRLEQNAEKLTALQTEISRCEAKGIRFENQIDDIKNRLWEDYELTFDQADSWRREIKSRSETSKRVGSIKSEMKSLGPVNVGAIEEYKTVQERYQFMSGQRDDIESSREKLNKVIDDLVVAMKEQFVEHFQLINDNFKQVFAELFGGGMAEVNLEDESDVLTSGIEIKAQPPGKKLQNLMLLSGGERCLTAIALLFAILKLRPTPFCVLDEVEAALDDANVSRFTEYIRNYANDSQFILVTHRKGTMEAADRLYGVTMQERGISKVLSMQLGD